MSDKSIVNIEKLVREIQNRKFGFLVDLSKKEERAAEFKLLNPIDKKKPFQLIFIAYPEVLVAAVPDIAKADAGSPVLCAIAHTNYDKKLGRFGWDPQDGEVRFISEVFFPDATHIDEDAVIKGYVNELDNILAMFYIGYLRIFNQQAKNLPDEVVENVMKQAEQKLEEIGIIHSDPAADATKPQDEDEGA
jgi:hypothetical protein